MPLALKGFIPEGGYYTFEYSGWDRPYSTEYTSGVASQFYLNVENPSADPIRTLPGPNWFNNSDVCKLFRAEDVYAPSGFDVVVRAMNSQIYEVAGPENLVVSHAFDFKVRKQFGPAPTSPDLAFTNPTNNQKIASWPSLICHPGDQALPSIAGWAKDLSGTGIGGLPNNTVDQIR